MNTRQLISLTLIAFALVIFFLVPNKKDYKHIEGLIFGTSYHVIYETEGR